jgi:GAF domain-containing protein
MNAKTETPPEADSGVEEPTMGWSGLLRAGGKEAGPDGEERGMLRGGLPRGGPLWERLLARERRGRGDALALLRAVEALNSAGRRPQVLDAVCGGARRLLRGESAEVRSVEEILSASGPGNAGSGLLLEAWALKSRTPIWLENAWGMQDLRLPPLPDGSTPGAAVAAPLFQAGQPSGVLAVYFAAPRLFTRTDRRLLLDFARQASVALQRSGRGEAA